MTSTPAADEDRLQVAASPNGKLVAVLVSSSSSQIRIALLQTSSGDLQTTLTYKQEGNVAKLLFLDDTHVAALVDHQMVLVWDLVRGVVAYKYNPTDATNKASILDVTVDPTTKSCPFFSILTAKEDKLQIHQVETTTGKLLKKVKAGKGNKASSALVASGNHCAVVDSNHSLRVIDSTTGSKVCKTSLLNNKKQKHVESSSTTTPLVVVVDGHSLCTTVQGHVVLVELKTGTVQQRWPLPSAATSLQVVDNNKIIVNETHVYEFDSSKKETLAKILHVDPAVDRSALVVGGALLWAVLEKRGGRFQLQNVSLDDDSKRVTISYKEIEAKSGEATKEETNKRQHSVVLGPGQAGGEARQASEGTTSKKARTTADSDDDDVEMSENDDNDETSPTIAQRLEQLQKAMDEEDAIDDDDNDVASDNDAANSFQPKKATTESLTQILQQALQSRDDTLLELALSVKDVKIVEKTCQAVADEFLDVLVTAITSRLAAKPARAEHLCNTWLMALLRTGRVRSMRHLQPLRNLLQERLEVFPALLQLDGKLSMLGSL
jgi:hypothetical protein